MVVRQGADVTVVTPHSEQDDTSIRAMAEVVRFGGRRGRMRRRGTPLRLASSGAFDRIIVTHAESWDLLQGRHDELTSPLLLDFQNVNSRWYRVLGQADTVLYWERIERQIVQTADVVMACSSLEAAALPEGPAEVFVATNGIDFAEWQEEVPYNRPEVPTLCAFGSWWYPPNVEGLEWFLEQVWPVVLAAVPKARLAVAGPGETPAALQHAPRAHHAGRVEDLRSFIAGTTATVVPVLRNPGTPVKFAEALAAGGPVVATSGAAAGFPDSPAVVADSPADFAAACADYLTHPGLAVSDGRRTRDYALVACPWESTNRPLAEWLG